MFENLDENIDLNLKLMYKSKNYELFAAQFTNAEKVSLNKLNSESFADAMVNLDLITRNNQLCRLTRFGIEVCEMGGWLKYLESQKKADQEELEYNEEKKQLEIENLRLQKENSEYAKEGRAKDEEIKKLTTENLRFGKKSHRRNLFYILLAALVGAFFARIDDILKFLGIIQDISN